MASGTCGKRPGLPDARPRIRTARGLYGRPESGCRDRSHRAAPGIAGLLPGPAVALRLSCPGGGRCSPKFRECLRTAGPAAGGYPIHRKTTGAVPGPRRFAARLPPARRRGTTPHRTKGASGKIDPTCLSPGALALPAIVMRGVIACRVGCPTLAADRLQHPGHLFRRSADPPTCRCLGYGRARGYTHRGPLPGLKTQTISGRARYGKIR